MAYTIPAETDYVLREGDRGIVVWALQRVCNSFGIAVVEDGDFGPATTRAAKALQQALGIVVDGVVGTGTQGKLAQRLCGQEERAENLPDKLLLSKIQYESGGVLGAVNWSVAGGVDCGITQRRVYSDAYGDEATIKRAFDPRYQINLSGNRVAELHDIFLAREHVHTHEGAYRLAVLNHNYPLLADKISRVGVEGLTSYYTTTQSWVTVHNLHFPDGAAIKTPLQWGQRYALGAPEHNEPGQAVKLVSW